MGISSDKWQSCWFIWMSSQMQVTHYVFLQLLWQNNNSMLPVLKFVDNCNWCQKKKQVNVGSSSYLGAVDFSWELPGNWSQKSIWLIRKLLYGEIPYKLLFKLWSPTSNCLCQSADWLMWLRDLTSHLAVDFLLIPFLAHCKKYVSMVHRDFEEKSWNCSK